MAQKFLKELLEEDQEPFYLKDYIANKKCMLKKQTQIIQIKKQKTKSIFPKNACFFSINTNSPDLRKSPLFDFSNSPLNKKSPSNNNKIYLHVPTKTASLLLEAALRIQQQKSKPKTRAKNSSGFGVFGSMLKRLTLRNRTNNNKLKNNTKSNNVEVNDVILTTTSVSSNSCCSSSSSSLDLESFSSGTLFNDDVNDGFEFINVLKDNNIINNNNDNFNNNVLCSSPFHHFAKSPINHLLDQVGSNRIGPWTQNQHQHTFEENINHEQGSSENCQLSEEDDEEKEQNSPVSVLDPPFEDDYDGHDENYYENQECSYAFVQRAKQQLLHKLQRFEKLAGLDPIELEKRMIEDEENDSEELMLRQQHNIDEYDFESFTFDRQRNSHDLLEDTMIVTSGIHDIKKPGIRRLISDLIIEEESVESVANDQQIIVRICKKLDQWKDVESNTIDMMVEMDLRREIGDWKKPQTEISATAIDIEVAIFAVLVKELVMDLTYSTDL